MYNSRHFAETRADVLLPLVRERGAGTLVVCGQEGLDAAMLPLEVDIAAGLLRCHVARLNPLWQAVSDSPSVLVIVMGVDHYISPQWYPSKAEHGKVVPTWNYEAIHLHGTATVFEEPVKLLAHLESLTRSQEGRLAQPWEVSDAPGDFLERQMRAIVGLEITMDRIEGKFKLGQNRSSADRLGAIAGLEAIASPAGDATAAAMRLRQGRDE